MVLFRRKVVATPSSRGQVSPESDVWFIPTTGEWFDSYDAYLDRMDFYNTRKFICELTGHSNLTYFEALISEQTEAAHVMRHFPDSLKEPILRRVQLSQVPRLDQLVDDVYNRLRTDFFPGEHVIAKVRDERLRVVIREKASFNAITMPNGEVRPAHSKFRVETVDGTDNISRELVVTESDLTRDRKIFTKMNLKAFIKHSVTRESWAGAPWLVKDDYAKMYRIDQTIPAHLQHTPLAAPVMGIMGERQRKKPGRKPQQQQQAQPLMPVPPGLFVMEPSPMAIQGITQPYGYPHIMPQQVAQGQVPGQVAMVAAPVQASVGHGKKRLIDDLQLPFNYEGAKLRPVLKHDYGNVTGSLLEVWAFLNVYNEPLVLDPFTFDDFADALICASADAECLLLVEIHCALLSVIVDKVSSRLQVALPRDGKEEHQDGGEKEEDVEDQKEEVEDTPAEDDDEKEDEEEEQDNESDSDYDPERDPENRTHRGHEFARLGSVDWKDRLRKRQFQEGGWQQILVGLLDTLANVEEWKETVRNVLNTMASLDRPVSLASALTGYYELSPKQRIQILAILCQLIHSSKIVRAYIDQCVAETVRLRRERSDLWREFKATTEALRTVDDESYRLKAALRSEGYDLEAGKFKEGQEAEVQEDGTKPLVIDLDDEPLTDNESDSESGEHNASILKEANTVDGEKPAMPDALSKEDQVARLKKLTASSKEMNERLVAVRAAVTQLEAEMRRVDCQRLKMLGKDRYHNRYWWFEGNGVLVEKDGDDVRGEDEDREDGDRDKEKEEPTGYVMGRLWVQGPSEEDARVFLQYDGLTDIDVKMDLATQSVVSEDGHVIVDGITGQLRMNPNPMQRKRIEEGPNYIRTMDDWGYYDTQTELDRLMQWLDSRGVREAGLAAALSKVRDNLSASMRAREEDLSADTQVQLRHIDEELDRQEEEAVMAIEQSELRDEDSDDDVELATGRKAKRARRGQSDELDEDQDGGGGDDNNDNDDDNYEESSDDSNSRKRHRAAARTQARRQTRKEVEEKKRRIRQVLEDRRDARIKMQEEVRPERLKRQKETREARRKELLLQAKRRPPPRVREWTNSSAIARFGTSHYDAQLAQDTPRKRVKKVR